MIKTNSGTSKDIYWTLQTRTGPSVVILPLPVLWTIYGSISGAVSMALH